MSNPAPPRPMGERRFGRINGLGLWTLILREVRRFTNVWMQTLMAPVATAALFMVIFSLAFAARQGDAADQAEFIAFLAPGILMMQVIQNAFANTSSSLLVSKVQGNIVDTLMPPLSPAELTIGYVAGGIARGLFVAAGVALVVFPVIGLGVAHPLWAIAFVLAGSALLSLLGILGAILADKFDQMAAISNFVIMPLSFLSGTFYSITILPGWLQVVSHLNPFFYMIDGIRYGVLGASDTSPLAGLVVILLFVLALWMLAHRWFSTGFRLKS